VIDEEDLRRMSSQERMALRRALARFDRSDAQATKAGERRRAMFLIFIVVCCVVLAAWTGLLAATLPRFYRAGGWRGAWVGFDIALLAAFAAAGWASWRRRQILIICLVVLATLLCCDAWFDVVLDARTSGFYLSLASALIIELPLAALAIFTARRLLRMTNAVMLRYLGLQGPVPRLRKIPLIGVTPGRPLSDLMAESAEELADKLASAQHAEPGPGRSG
jgi:cation transport ATPase